MTWAKIDDHANEHRKQLAAGAEACWLWTCGLMYANRQAARDGFIPDGMLQMLYPLKAPAKLALRLVEVGLWSRITGGYLIHQFTFWNQTKEQRDAELSSGRERAAKSHSLRAKNRKSSGEDTAKTSGEENTDLQDSSGSLSTPIPLPSQPERESAHAPAEDPQANWDGSERDTICPSDLVQRAIAVGVPAALAETLRVAEASVLDSLREFVGYWTIGAGANQKRRLWMRKAREHVRRSAEQNKLKPPGAVEHEIRGVEPALSPEYLAGVSARLAKSRTDAPTECEVDHG